MLDDIQSGKVNTDYVLVFKLSRFGRNARDVLNSLEFITGRVAWGKRRTEKVPGKDNEYRLVKQDEYILSEVISHEAFVSKEDFDKYAERRRADMTRRLNDLYDQIYKAEDLLQESLMKKATLEGEQMSVQSMIGILSSFDAIYDRMNAGHLSKRWRCLKTAALIKVRS